MIGEYAVVTARRAVAGCAGRGGERGAAAALRLMDEPVRVISTVQVGITAIGILAGRDRRAARARAARRRTSRGWLGFLIAFGVVTYLTVVLGELVPKALTLDAPETLAVLVARPIELISVVLRPVVWVLEDSAALVLRPFGSARCRPAKSIRTPEELRALVDEAEGSRRDPARAGGAPAQRLRLPRPRGARRHGARAPTSPGSTPT